MFFLTFLLTTTMAGMSASNVMNLMMAIEGMDTVQVKELLNTVDIESKDEFGMNVLHSAVHSNGEITRLLISHGADRVVNHSTQSDISSPVFHACFFSSQYENSQPRLYEIIEAMLKAGGDPNVSDSALRTPLHYLTTIPEVRLLISYGANVNAKDADGYTPVSTYFIRLFCQKDHELLYALADGNADFAITNDFGDTIFHIKSDRNTISWTKELVMFLARNGVPLDALNDRGETALTKILKSDLLLDSFGMAPDSISYENVKDSFYGHMAEAGANLNAPNQRGETLLLLAVLKYHPDIAKWLLENGADAEAKNADGDPPLLALIKQEKRNYVLSNYSLPGRDKMAKMMAVIDVLVERGADVEFSDKGGRNAAYYLRESGITWLNIRMKRSRGEAANHSNDFSLCE